MNIPENVWTSKSGNDFLALYSAKGQLLGYIDQNGVPQGSLAGGSGVAPQIATVTLTNSQLLNLSTVPVMVIPAFGPEKYVAPQSIAIVLMAGNTPFQISNSGSGTTYMYWEAAGTGPSGNYATLVMGDSIANSGVDYTNSESQLFIYASLLGQSVPVDLILNQPLMISMNDVLSVGDGTMLITISYVVVTV